MGYINLWKKIYMINMANVVGELQYIFLVKHQTSFLHVLIISGINVVISERFDIFFEPLMEELKMLWEVRIHVKC
jgi:hypothetical protein